VFPVRYGQTYRVELSFKRKAGRWLMSRIVIVTLVGKKKKTDAIDESVNIDRHAMPVITLTTRMSCKEIFQLL
jgi:hypothetical protein